MSNPIWRLNRPNFQPEELISAGFGKLLSSVLAGRFATAEEAYEHVSTHKTTPPSVIPELTGTARAVIKHAKSGRVFISGDYDADGICATAMLVFWLRQNGAAVDWYLPNRSIGYGFNAQAVERAATSGATLIIVVDSGTNDIKTCRSAIDKGIEVVIIDHHEPMYGRPPVNYFVNPKYISGQMEFTSYCAAGLVYKLIEEMSQRVNVSVPPEITILAAIATIADVMPLEHENRYIVKHGLLLWPLVDLPGIVVLRDALGITVPDVRSISHVVAPCINAPGRLDKPDIALEMLTTGNYNQARELVSQLVELNQERQRLVTEAEAIVLEKLNITDNDRVIIVSDKSIPHGVAGLVAGHLCSRYSRPAIVLSESGSVWKGSGRAPEDYDLIDALKHVGEFLESFGGHKQAVGASMCPEKIDTVRNELNKLLPPPKPPVMKIDTIVTPSEIDNIDEAVQLKMLEPYGHRNPQPTFLVRRATPVYLGKTSTGEHVRFKLGNTWFIWFGGGNMYDSIKKPWDIAFGLGINNYNGRLESKGIVRAATQHINLNRELIGTIYEAIHTNTISTIASAYADVLQPALATLEELGLISYHGDSAVTIPTCEKKDLRSSGIYATYIT